MTGLLVVECDHDMAAMALPRPEVNLVARFGPSSPRGLDVHAFGIGQRVRRKTLRKGMRTVTARLRLGTAEAVLGVSASALAGRIVSLEELWGDAAARRLYERLAATRATREAGAVLERAIAERLSGGKSPRAALALAAADRLASANVAAVADDLGVSERHLRRAFREAVGVSPKAFAKLTRFHRALRAARADVDVSWATIAAGAGYCDQAHLIAEFRAIAGVTPRALLGELRATPSLG